jgi:hypothetical protein
MLQRTRSLVVSMRALARERHCGDTKPQQLTHRHDEMSLLWRELRQPHQRTTNLRAAQVHKQDADEHQGAVRVSGAW